MRSRRHWEKGNGTVMEIFGMGGTSRQRKAFFAALVGLIINLILGMVKIFVGWQSGFLSVIGDGFNNLAHIVRNGGGVRDDGIQPQIIRIHVFL